MRKEYYKLLNKNELLDILHNIDELAYSKKYKIIEALVEKFDPSIINLALIKYQDSYMSINKYNLSFIKNTLIYLCKKEKENEML